MPIAQMMLPEFDKEMENTRRALDLVPDEQWNWKPHEKSGTVGWLASHVATMPGWMAMIANTDQFDYAPVGGGPAYQPPKIENRKQLLAEFEKNIGEARASLVGASDERLLKEWSLLGGGKPVFTMPRAACIRSMVMNHIIHHRAQLLVYFRLLGVPVPGLYGPSADEQQSAGAGAAAAN